MTGAAMLALGLGSPAAAERVQAQLSVRVTVLPPCIVTTASAAPSNQLFTCTHGERPRPAADGAADPPPPRPAAADSGRPRPTKMVTLTY